MTNLEVLKLKIANMTAEEFGEFLDNAGCELCLWGIDGGCAGKVCVEGYAAYLKQEHIPTVKQVEKQKTVTEIHLMCSCGGEYFEEIGMGLSTAYHHRCNQCGNVIDCNDGYPRLKE